MADVGHMNAEKEFLIDTNVNDIMKSAYIDYSMSVIVSRALPDARDGFKPVHRRILYAMFREGLLHNRPFDKCAGVVGEVLKNYHPHSDSAVYESLVRLAQDWVMRYPLGIPSILSRTTRKVALSRRFFRQRCRICSSTVRRVLRSV